MAGKSEVYKSEPVRTNVLLGVLALQIAGCVIVFMVAMNSGDAIIVPEPWLVPYNAVAQSLNYLPMVANICLVFWIFRANKNAGVLSDEPLDTSPGWAVGWFFVPFACWWKPYEVVREVYKASRSTRDWRETGDAAIVGWWWCAYLLGCAIGLLVRLSAALDGHLYARPLAIGISATMAIHQALLFVIVTRIVKWQAKADRAGGVEAVF